MGILAIGPASVAQLVEVRNFQCDAFSNSKPIAYIIGIHLHDSAAFSSRQTKTRIRQQGLVARCIVDGESTLFIKHDGDDPVA